MHGEVDRGGALPSEVCDSRITLGRCRIQCGPPEQANRASSVSATTDQRIDDDSMRRTPLTIGRFDIHFIGRTRPVVLTQPNLISDPGLAGDRPDPRNFACQARLSPGVRVNPLTRPLGPVNMKN